ncbi:MAG: radical SAM protein [Candidatus Nanoarchaeia archaeon]
MIVKEVNCKSILNRTTLGFDFCINPYIGCSNSCVYCYARFMLRYTKHKERWGSFVDVKSNAVNMLKKDLRRKPMRKCSSVFLSSVTDPYQFVECYYKLTRSILETLPKNFRPTILTKSSLVIRDIDVLKEFEEVEVGMTITSLNDWVNFEPNSSPVEERINALRELQKEGIGTYVFLGPVLPYITEKDLDALMDSISFVDYVMVDRLNIKCNNWYSIRNVLVRKYPDLLEKFSEAVFSNNYFSDFKERIKSFRNDLDFCY